MSGLLRGSSAPNSSSNEPHAGKSTAALRGYIAGELREREYLLMAEEGRAIAFRRIRLDAYDRSRAEPIPSSSMPRYRYRQRDEPEYQEVTAESIAYDDRIGIVMIMGPPEARRIIDPVSLEIEADDGVWRPLGDAYQSVVGVQDDAVVGVAWDLYEDLVPVNEGSFRSWQIPTGSVTVQFEPSGAASWVQHGTAERIRALRYRTVEGLKVAVRADNLDDPLPSPDLGSATTGPGHPLPTWAKNTEVRWFVPWWHSHQH